MWLSEKRGEVKRGLLTVALIAGLFVSGGLCGLAVRTIGGLEQQRAQLNRCVLASRQAHPNERPRDALTRLMVQVPACMNEAGYEQVVNDMSCSREAWQGDVFCYVPKSYLRKLIYRLDAARVARLQSEAVPRSKVGGV
ncbi:MAG TPA: hypothetical protein VK696_03500 [Steroidobacteraceae bacterium]|jgi:hypothetical protein|nr:hypothetical protein [Steroidobacteraceae bacterium]